MKAKINLLKMLVDKSAIIGTKSFGDQDQVCQSTFQSEYGGDSDSTDLWDTFHQERESIPSFNLRTAPLQQHQYKIDDAWSHIKNINFVDSSASKVHATQTAKVV